MSASFAILNECAREKGRSSSQYVAPRSLRISIAMQIQFEFTRHRSHSTITIIDLKELSLNDMRKVRSFSSQELTERCLIVDAGVLLTLIRLWNQRRSSRHNYWEKSSNIVSRYAMENKEHANQSRDEAESGSENWQQHRSYFPVDDAEKSCLSYSDNSVLKYSSNTDQSCIIIILLHFSVMQRLRTVLIRTREYLTVTTHIVFQPSCMNPSLLSVQTAETT